MVAGCQPRNWTTVPLGSLCEAIYDGPHATPKKTDTGPVFLGISNLAAGRLDLLDVDHLSESDYPRWTRRVMPRNEDIVFSYETRLGQAAMIPTGLRCCLGRRMGLLRVNRAKADPRFLLYAWLSPTFQRTIYSRAVSGSTVDRILLTELASYPITVPPFAEQRRIGELLGALDDKIELNRRMNRTIKEMARAIFKAWFVDFLPVRAKADGARSLPGMPQGLFGLAPDEIVGTQDSPLPKGWQWSGLDEIADFLNGLALQNYRPEGSEYLPVIKIAETRRGVTPSSERASPKIDPRYVVHDGDLLFSWSGSLDVCLWSGGPGALNQHLFKVTSDRYPQWFYYQWVGHHLPQFQAIAAGKATTMGHIQRHHLSEARCAVPPPEFLAGTGKVLAPLHELVVRDLLEARCLAQLRDLLLPKLLTGRLGVQAVGVCR